MHVPHHSFDILSPSTSWFDGYFLNPQYRSVGQISMVLGQYQPFWWNSFSLFGYVEDSPFWIVSDHFGRLKSANLVWSSCLNEFVSLVDTSKWQFYCDKGDITLSQFEIYRYLFCVRSPWKSRMVDSSMTKTTPIADLRGKSCGPANSNCPADQVLGGLLA